MRTFLVVLVLIFSLQSWTKADDIRDFEIEGMSIGDNLLNYFTKNEIINNLANYYNDKEYSVTELDSANPDYILIQVHYKKEGKKFIIYALDGLFEIENMQQCINKKNNIADDMSSVFKNTDREDRPDAKMASGHGVMHNIKFYFDSGDFAEITCYDYNKQVEDERGWADHGRVAIVNKKLSDWIINKAFK